MHIRVQALQSNSKGVIEACQDLQRTHDTEAPTIVQKPKGSQKELFDESKKEQPQRWVKQAYPSCATECSGLLAERV